MLQPHAQFISLHWHQISLALCHCYWHVYEFGEQASDMNRRYSRTGTTYVVAPRMGSLGARFRASCAASLGGFLAGVQLSLVSGLLELDDFKVLIAPTIVDKANVSVAFVIGSILFALPAGPICDRYGRRKALIGIALASTVATIMMTRTSSTTTFMVARVISGAAFSMSNIVCPMYNAEIAPIEQRGLYVNMYQLAITLGILTSQISSVIVVLRNMGFRFILVVSQIPSILMIVGVIKFVPETPAWLESRGWGAEAEASKASLNMSCSSLGTSAEVDSERGSDIATSSRKSAQQSHGNPDAIGALSVLMTPSARRRLLIAAGVQSCQQLTGVNNIIFYAPTMIAAMFGAVNASANSRLIPFASAAMIGLVNVIFTLISLLVVDRFGRVTILLATAIPMVCALVILAGVGTMALPPFIGVFAIMLFIVGFAVGWGPVPFLVSSEVFPIRYRGLGMTASALIMSIVSLGVTGSFLQLHEALGSAVFAIYAALCASCAVFVYFCVPETRGLTNDQIDMVIG
jgi:MFS transporter, SP family, galactose:H+ symporter